MQDSKIIQEVGEDFGLTKEQAQLLWDQYWNEYVLRNLSSEKYVSIMIKDLGVYYGKLKRMQKRISILEKMKDRLKDRFDPVLDEELKNLTKVVSNIEKRNEKFKSKRYYG